MKWLVLYRSFLSSQKFWWILSCVLFASEERKNNKLEQCKYVCHLLVFLFLFHDTQSILGCYGLFNGRGRIYSGARTREHLALLPFSLHGPFDESWKMSVCRQRLLAHQLSKLFIFCFFLFFLEIQTFCRTLNQNNLFFSNLPFEIIYIFSPTSKFRILFGIVIPLSPPTFDRSRPRENNQWWNKAFAGLKGETLLIDFHVVV